MHPDADAARAVEVRGHLLRTVAALAEVHDVEVGWVASAPGLPLVHSLNQVHVTTAAPPDDLLGLAERHQRDLGYRHLVVDDATSASSLADGLEGWKVEREVLMALSGGPSRPVDASRVSGLDEDEAGALMRRWLEEEGFGAKPGVVDQLLEATLREGRVWTEQRLGVRDGRGAAVAMTKLRTNGHGSAWVEDVYTLPEARGRGHARTLVTEAVRRAAHGGSRLTFIVADDEDWPKHLYADVGFRPVARSWSFHRDLA